MEQKKAYNALRIANQLGTGHPVTEGSIFK